MKSADLGVLYRYYGVSAHGFYSIHCETFMIIKKTPKGCWISYRGKKKFVLDEGRKKYAHSTKENALISFKFRKKKQIKILASQLLGAERFLAMANGGKFSEDFAKLRSFMSKRK